MYYIINLYVLYMSFGLDDRGNLIPPIEVNRLI